MQKEVYDPEVYWSKVANEISNRKPGGGDNRR